MRGYQKPSLRPNLTDAQSTFRSLSRHRRAHLARAAQTTLVKADHWARGHVVPEGVAEALDGAFRALKAKGAKK